MIRFRYAEIDGDLLEKLASFERLLDLFHYLLLKASGDAEAALDLLRQLKNRGYIDGDLDLDEFALHLEKRDLVRKENGGRRRLTDRGVRAMRRSSFERIFRGLKRGGPAGGHVTPYGGGGAGEPLPERREFRFGDDIERIDFNSSIWNTVRRTGGTDTPLVENDLVVCDTEFSTSCATVLLLDISHSMILYGEDRFTPAKQVALALTELILSRYRKDTLDVVLFGDDATTVPVSDLPFADVGPHHTNTKAGLAAARRILERRKNRNKQIFMVTDGKPTVIRLPGEGIYRNAWGLDEKIVNRTLDEAVVCRRKGIVITTFMVAGDPYLERFVRRLTELNRGRAYFTSPDRVGDFIFVDFIRNRRRRRG